MKTGRFFMVVSAGLLLVLSASVAEAQRGGGRGGFGRGMSKVMLIGQEAVQTELALTEAQKDKINAIRQELPQPPAGGGGPGRGGGEFFARIAELDTKVDETLDEKQRARLQQIVYQAAGTLSTLSREEVAAKLELTSEQKDRIDDLVQEQRDAMREIFQSGGGDRDAMREKMTEVRKEMDSKAKALLNPGQSEKLGAMLGEPFDTSKLQLFFGPGFGRGGRRPQ